jgi:hypothetical protein
MKKEEVIVRFKGGLGNQMFQYLFYYGLLKRGHRVFAEKQLLGKNYQKDTIFELFDLDVKFKTLSLIDSFKRFILRFHGRFFGTKIRLANYVLDEKQIIVNYNSIRPGDILEGYWQNPCFFELDNNYIDAIFSFGSLTLKLSDEQLKLVSSIEKQDSLVIHVRKADYVGNEIFDGICNKEYYKSALEKFNGINNIFIFTDDTAWVNENLRFDNIILIKNHPAIDLLMISKSKNLILSNSTFSWWGAYLNKDSVKKTVVVPKKWFNTNSMEFKGYIDDWIKL